MDALAFAGVLFSRGLPAKCNFRFRSKDIEVCDRIEPCSEC